MALEYFISQEIETVKELYPYHRARAASGILCIVIPEPSGLR